MLLLKTGLENIIQLGDYLFIHPVDGGGNALWLLFVKEVAFKVNHESFKTYFWKDGGFVTKNINNIQLIIKQPYNLWLSIQTALNIHVITFTAPPIPFHLC